VDVNPIKLNKRVLLGLMGSEIQASRSPIMYEREGDAQGFRCLYQLIDLAKLKVGIEAIPELLRAAERLGFRGINITHPCKQAVMGSLSEIAEDAREVGAVNTVLFQEGKRIGFNTDWIGFFNSFKRGLSNPAMDRVVQFGAGGAGAATAYALLKLGARCVKVIEPDTARSNELMERMNSIFGEGRVCCSTDLKQALEDADGIVNATPIGMYGHPGIAFPAEMLRSQFWVAEVVYFPRETELLTAARAAGCQTLDGTGMAIYQAAAAFQHFFNTPPDMERMYKHFAEYDETGR
jgi:shikimate dehydrogenase